MRSTKKTVGLMMLAAFIISLSTAAFMVYADNDSWEDHASTDWYMDNYTTYTIDTADKLAGVAKLVNSGVTDFHQKVLEISVNLDVKDHKWVPVGNEGHPFRGTLVGKNGQIYDLAGLTIAGNVKQAGLFGYMSGATVGGLRVAGDIQINANDRVQVGAIAGFMDQNSIVYNVTNAAQIRVTSTKEAYVGGIVGSGTGLISNSVNTAAVSVDGSTTGIVGGIVAASTGGASLTLKKIENTGAVTVSNSVYQANIGGLVGLASSSLLMKDEDTVIRNLGHLTATNNKSSIVGGIVGRVEAGPAVAFSKLTSNLGNINVLAPDSKGSIAGGLVGSFEQNMNLDVPFTQSGSITNQAGSTIITGGVTGIVYGDLTLGYDFANVVPIIASGEGELYTGGIAGKTGGNVTFVNAAKNTASLQVTGTGDRIYTGGLVGFAGNRVMFLSTANSAYLNSGTIRVAGVSEVYTGGIAANKAYVKAANNVQSLGDIAVSGSHKLYTGGYVGVVSGSDTAMSNESFANNITVTAASSSEDSAVYSGGIVGYYSVNSTITSPTFGGQLLVTGGGKGVSTGGIAGYVDGGTITGATVGGTAESFAAIASEGRVGGVAGYMNGTVSSSTMQWLYIQSNGADGYAGGLVGRAKGSITGATVGKVDAADHRSGTISATASNAAAGGIVGADDGALLIGSATVSKITVSAALGADHASVGGVAGAASASVTLGGISSAISVHDVTVTNDGAASKVGGVVGDNSANLNGSYVQEVTGVTIDAKGDDASLGGITGINQGDLTGLKASNVAITARGANNAIGGLAGTAKDNAIQGNGTVANVSGLTVATTSTASGAKVGGIVGSSDKTSLQSVVAENPALTIRGTGSMVGGLAGQIKDALISQSYARGVMPDYVVLNIYGSNSHGGGLVGQAERVSVTGSTSDHLNVENVMLVVDGSASGVHVGGLVGTNIETTLEKMFGQFINLTPKGPLAVIGGLTGYNKGSETAVLNQNFLDSLAINVPASATNATIGGMIGLNDARSGQGDATAIERAVSTVQNSRILGKLIVHAPSATTGGMVGENRSVLANNSIAEKLPITSDGNFGVVGGLIGKNTGTVYYTYSNALLSVSGASTVIGGLVGENSGNVIASYIESDLKGDVVGASGNYALLGGLIGKNSGNVDKSFTSSKVTANGSYTYVGGLVGGNTGTIKNSYAAKEVTANAADAYAGGLVGLLKTGTVKGSYSAGQVNANQGAFAGGFAGYYDNASKELIDNTYYVKDENQSLNSGLLDFGGGTYYELNRYARLSPILAESLANRATFPALSGWTFSDTAWRYGSLNAEYPYPELNLTANTGGSTGGTGGGNGGSGNQVNMNINWYTKKPSALRFVIQTEADLAGLAGIVNGTITGVEPFDFKGREIELTAPIHLQSNQWTPIGYTEQHAFEGTFIGNRKLISGLQVTTDSVAGLFGVIGEYATVQEIDLEPVGVTGNQYVGSLAGTNKGTVSHIQVTLDKAAKVANGSSVGGILGKNTGTISHLTLVMQGGSSVTSAVNTATLGGLVGDNVSDVTEGHVTLTSGTIEATGENAIVGGAFGRLTGHSSRLAITITAESVVQTTGTGGITGGLVGDYLSGTSDELTVALTDGKIKGLSILGGAIGRSGRDQVIKMTSVRAVNTTAGVNIQGNGLVGGLVGDKIGKGIAALDMEGVSVKGVSISNGDSSTLGGIVGVLTNAAVKDLVFEGSLRAAGKDVIVGGIAGHSVDSIIYQPQVSPTIGAAVTMGENSIGGVVGIADSSHGDTALDFGYLIPFYPGVYGANVRDTMIEVTGSNQQAQVKAGTIAGQLLTASIYNSTSEADLRVTGLKTATLGGVVGFSSGYIVNTSVTSGIEANLSSEYTIGGIVGRAHGGKIAYARAQSPYREHLAIGDSITVERVPTATHVGGVVGMADGTDMQNVSANLPIQVQSTNPYNTIYAGGFAGLLGDSTPGSMKRVYAEGAVNVSGKAGAFTGGFAGSVNAYTLREAYASGSVANTAFDARAGGFAGVINRGGVIVDAYASQVSVTALGSSGATRSYAGGFTGYNDGSLTRVYANVTTISAQAGGANSYMGALIGYNFRDGVVANAYYTGNVTPIKYDTSSGQAANVKLADFSNHNKLSNWHFSTNDATWSYVDGLNRNAPVLVDVTNWSFAPDVTFLQAQMKGDPQFTAASAAQLAGLGMLNNELEFYTWFDRAATNPLDIQRIALRADIDLTNELWTPFSSYGGEFDGENHVISGLTYLADEYDNYGFISNLHGRLANVTFDHAAVIGGTHTGIAVGTNHVGAMISNVSVSNANMQGFGDQIGSIAGVNNGTMNQVSASGVGITGTSDVGGIAGVNAGTIQSAAVYGSLTGSGSYSGGIVGHNKAGASITQSFSYADVTVIGDAPNAGGLAGENDGVIADSYNSGAVTASGKTMARAGGIAGYALEGTLTNTVNSGQISANIEGFLVKGKSFIGGIAGQIGQRTTLLNNYYDEQMLQSRIAYVDDTGHAISADVGKAAAMQTKELVNGVLPAGLNRSIWGAKTGYYPQLTRNTNSIDSDLSTVAVILKSGDTAYRVTGSYSHTIDSALEWTIDERAQQTVLTASKNGGRRSVTINKKPVLYAATASKPTGTGSSIEFKEKMDVTLATAELSGTIYYTLDGSTPSENSLVYSQAITLNATTTIKAITSVDGKNNSEVFSATYKKMVPVVAGGGGGFAPPQAGSTVEVLVNGKAESAGLETILKNGTAVTSTITVNEQAMGKLLEQASEHTEITLVFNNHADIAIGELSAEMLQKMANKQADLKVDAGTASYRIPAQEFQVKQISEQLGSSIPLQDIKVRIEMRSIGEDHLKRLNHAAATGGYSLLASPVSFKVTYTYGDKSYELDKFNSFVERTVRLTSETEVGKLSTAVMVDQDGTIRHVPTLIRRVDGNVYAVIRTLSSGGEYALISNPVSFTDVKAHWAQDTMNDMGARMILGGVGENRFEPDREITRAEFAAIVVKALGLTSVSGRQSYLDVHASDWYAPYLQAATQYGLITGYENGEFGPMDAISREQVMTIIGRAIHIVGLEASLTISEVDQLLAVFADSSDMDEYALSGIATSLKLGLVSGRSEGMMVPDDNMTRAEVATIIQKLLKKSGLN